MKNLIVTTLVLILCVFGSNAQIGGALNKAKNAKNKAAKKIEQVKSEKKSSGEENETESTTGESVTPEESESTPVTSTPTSTDESETKEESPANNDLPLAKEEEPDKPNDGITSPMHEKYMGKIVWSTTPEGIAYKNEKEGLFAQEATLGSGEIRYRVYMDNSLVNYLKHMSLPTVHGRYKINYYLDGNMIGSRNLQADEFTRDAKRNYTTFKGALKTTGSKLATGEDEFQNILMKNESLFTVGAHKFRMEIMPYQDWPEEYTGEVVASGEITLNVKGKLFDPNDEKVCLPKSKMKDAALEAKVLKAFQAKGWEETPKEVRILSSKWNIVRNQYTGVITSRYIDAVVGSVKNGKCMYQSFSFYQDYDGSSYQSEVYLSGIGSQTEVSCGCMK